MTDTTPVDRQAVPPWTRRVVVLSLGVFVLTVLLAVIAGSGVFEGGSCGGFGTGCAVSFMLVGGIGCAVGVVLALAALALTGPRPLLNWLALLLNGVPLVVCLEWFSLL